MHVFLWYTPHPAPRPLASPAAARCARRVCADDNNNNNARSHRRIDAARRGLTGARAPRRDKAFPPYSYTLRAVYNERKLD